VSAEDLEAGRPRPGGRQEAVELRYLRPATFQGSFVAPEDGDYRFVPFPRMKARLLGGAAEGFMCQYPTTELAVEGGDGESDGWPVVPVAAVTALGATFALVVAQRRRRRLRLAVTP
jgi:hypothetical protein